MSHQLSARGGLSELATFLGQVPLKSLIRHDAKRDFVGTAEVISVFSTDQLLDVIKVLFKFNIASVPVVSPAEQTDEKKSAVFDFWMEPKTRKQGVVLGFVDMVDILSFIVSTLPPSQEQVEAWELAGRSLLESPIANVINFSQKDKAVPIAQDHFVLEALQYFAQGTHRVLLFDDNKALSGLCSQFDVIRLLHSHFAKGELQAFNVNFAKLSAPVEAIRPTDTVFQAIQRLGSGALRTLAVVDILGSLVGNFSSSDIGYAFAVGKREGDELQKSEVLHSIFCNLNLTVQDYLAKFHPQSLMPQVGLPNIKLDEVCKVMAECNFKQLWITDDLKTKAPIGVITQTDVCRRVAELCL